MYITIYNLMVMTKPKSIMLHKDTKNRGNLNTKDSHQITKNKRNFKNYKNNPKTNNKMAISTHISIVTLM